MENPVKFAATPSSSSSSQSLFKLKILCIGNVEDLISLPEEHVQNFISLDIQDDKLVNLEKLREVFTSLSSLRQLRLTRCHGLRSLSGGMEHLTSLEKLVIWNYEELDLVADGILDDGGMHGKPSTVFILWSFVWFIKCWMDNEPDITR
ncbi:hypothetical protein Ancab_026071 [Ancistrocladus abbreviatus]